MAIEKVKERIQMYAEGKGKLYQLILMDYSMPGMDGPTTVSKIIKLYQESPHVTEEQLPYICCCTAYPEQQFKMAAIDAGMSHFLTKPISMEQLEDLLTLLTETE